jgi:SCY1-like protein 1
VSVAIDSHAFGCLIYDSDLDQLSDDFPEDYFKMKILPELLKSVEFGGGGAKVFGVVMKISKKLTDDEFEAKVTPAVVRLFSSPDRAIRVSLLDNLPVMIDRLPQKIVNDKIFPQMASCTLWRCNDYMLI